MKKKSLETLDFNHFELYGIACFEKDYRLTYFLNKELNIDLEKESVPIKLHLNNTNHELPYFYTDEADFEMFMFSNNIDGNKMLPKYKNINYWMLIKKSPISISDLNFEHHFSNIDVILGSFKIKGENEIKAMASLFYA